MHPVQRVARSLTIDAHRSAGAGLVDVHTHAIDIDLPDLRQAYPHDLWPSVDRSIETEARLIFGGVPYRRIDHRCWSPEARLVDMDREGVAVQVLSPIPVTFCYRASAAGAAELASAQNEFFARIVHHHPIRFAALGAVALQDPDRAVEEMRRCMRHRGFLGVEIGTQVAGTELADPTLDRFFAVAHELGALVLVHPSDQDLSPRVTELGLGFGAGMPTETALAAAALIVGGALSRRPEVRICLAHGGGALPGLIGRLDKGAIIAGTTPDSPNLPSRLTSQLWCDSLTYNRQALNAAVGVFGSDHVVFGSDYPFPAMPEPIDNIVA
ncbi:MAG TPA: amidohydrolase family protein, partial [Mycobacterium sp.]|nr:amidohydrolase family protein [Mycobacterium sp.]